jgi:hypothetical protein
VATSKCRPLAWVMAEHPPHMGLGRGGEAWRSSHHVEGSHPNLWLLAKDWQKHRLWCHPSDTWSPAQV